MPLSGSKWASEPAKQAEEPQTPKKKQGLGASKWASAKDEEAELTPPSSVASPLETPRHKKSPRRKHSVDASHDEDRSIGQVNQKEVDAFASRLGSFGDGAKSSRSPKSPSSRKQHGPRAQEGKSRQDSPLDTRREISIKGASFEGNHGKSLEKEFSARLSLSERSQHTGAREANRAKKLQQSTEWDSHKTSPRERAKKSHPPSTKPKLKTEQDAKEPIAEAERLSPEEAAKLEAEKNSYLQKLEAIRNGTFVWEDDEDRWEDDF